MNRAEKRKFIRDLCNNVRDEILGKVGSMPDEWNGIELRLLIADKFAGVVFHGTQTRKRKRDYNNEVLARNL